MARKITVTNRNKLASMICKLEGGKSEIKIGDMRQALKMIVVLEAALIVKGHRSGLMVLRREAVAKAKKLKSKQGKP